MKLRYDIKGLDCAHCAANLESEISEIEGVTSASVSFMTLKLEIEFEDDKKDVVLEKVMKLISDEELEVTLDE